MIVDCRLNFAI